jgi:hypothetical protein
VRLTPEAETTVAAATGGHMDACCVFHLSRVST